MKGGRDDDSKPPYAARRQRDAHAGRRYRGLHDNRHYLLPLSPTPQVVRLTRKEVDSMRKYGLLFLGSAFLLWAAAISMALAKIIIMLR
jgi:hypothetical protein